MSAKKRELNEEVESMERGESPAKRLDDKVDLGDSLLAAAEANKEAERMFTNAVNENAQLEVGAYGAKNKKKMTVFGTLYRRRVSSTIPWRKRRG